MVHCSVSLSVCIFKVTVPKIRCDDVVKVNYLLLFLFYVQCYHNYFWVTRLSKCCFFLKMAIAERIEK